MSDGHLRQLFQKHIPDFHWQGIETGSTGRGIPDMNYCFDGIEGWVENKLTSTRAVDLRPEQISWMERRTRRGGRTFVAVRRKHAGGPRKGPPVDELWIYPGSLARDLYVKGLDAEDGPYPLLYSGGGPAKWGWEYVRTALLND